MPVLHRGTVMLLLALLVAAPAAAQQVGVNSAVNTDATGTPPGARARPLAIGQQVVHNEHIVTDAGGQAQILFLDESAMTIGPGSDLTIDEFVYDPQSGSGRLAMNATRGVMRFVGGRISKLENGVTMQTPSGTIGIRGGIFLMNLQRNGTLDVVLLYGKDLTVKSGGVLQSITRPGYAVSVAGRGAAPSAPAPAPAGQLAGLLAQVSGKPGANGGATTTPTDASVAGSGVSNTISGDVNASVQQAGLNRPAAQPTVINIASLQTNLQVNNTATQSAQQQVSAGPVMYTDGFVVKVGGSDSGLQTSFTGTLSNGQLTVPAQPGIDKGGTLPLPPGQATFGPITLNANDSSQAVGSTFLTPDRSAFTAVVSDATGGFGTQNGKTTFVVGGVPTVNLPTAGVGSYSGVANGLMQNQAGAIANASGGFSGSYNFATQQGSVSFSNFGGQNFGGPVAGTGGNTYGGQLSGGGGASGAVLGKFFGGGASTTGGIFAVSGQTYNALGVYAGSQQH